MKTIWTLLLLLLFINVRAQKNLYPIITPHVIVENAEGGICTISLYTPYGLTIRLSPIRPDFTPENYLCVPGAYTTMDTHIDGLYIEDGNVISETINNKLTGACILSKDSIQFLGLAEINSQLISQIKLSKKSFFQQSLLVKNNQIVPCDLFRSKENLRRALIEFKDNYFLIGESQTRVTISDFQESLVKIGAINAINLDMGTWSEGWYKNHNGEKITVGEKMISTNKQTNWIIYTRQ